KFPTVTWIRLGDVSVQGRLVGETIRGDERSKEQRCKPTCRPVGRRYGHRDERPRVKIGAGSHRGLSARSMKTGAWTPMKFNAIRVGSTDFNFRRAYVERV